ncbi:MAG: SDR family NAD(P)-dependent oxidoreductase [Opitutae bacterium]|nr:SDR family NAD(P)-dependent oxidoreductase [Opitutae bacterium]
MEKKTAIVTGGSSGIGLAICERLLDRGMEVHSISRNPRREKDNEFLHPVKLDLSDLDAVTRYGKSFIDENGTPDLLVNNAGYGAFYEWEEFPEDEIIRQTAVLFSAPILLCKAFAPLMAKSGKGTIVNVTSLVTLFPLPYMPLYNAGKSGLSSFTQSLMLEYPEYPRLIDFRLGDVRTSFNQSAPKQQESKQPESMKRAWKKIESQLVDSPVPRVAALQIVKALEKNKSGIFYGGGWFQSRLAPLICRILPSSLLNFVLKARYGLS